METPNTRSRKRPSSQNSQPASQEGSGVTWAQDTELLDELRARPAAPLPLPSPTQRPRAFAPRSTGGPRKRPCRLVRGATPSASASSTLVSSLGSALPPTPVDTRRLDELLEKFDLWRTPPSAPASRTTQPVRRPLGERTNRIVAAQSLPDVKRGTLDRRTTQSLEAPAKPRVPPPPLPRVVQRARDPEEVDMRRPFRTPWAAPLRSSPRRKPPVDYSPVRASRAPAQRDTPSRLRRAVQPPPPLPPPAEDMPSSEGDTSVDSLDMLLGAGGDDVQDLFSMLDAC